MRDDVKCSLPVVNLYIAHCICSMVLCEYVCVCACLCVHAPSYILILRLSGQAIVKHTAH